MFFGCGSRVKEPHLSGSLLIRHMGAAEFTQAYCLICSCLPVSSPALAENVSEVVAIPATKAVRVGRRSRVLIALEVTDHV